MDLAKDALISGCIIKKMVSGEYSSLSNFLTINLLCLHLHLTIYYVCFVYKSINTNCIYQFYMSFMRWLTH